MLVMTWIKLFEWFLFLDFLAIPILLTFLMFLSLVHILFVHNPQLNHTTWIYCIMLMDCAILVIKLLYHVLFIFRNLQSWVPVSLLRKLQQKKSLVPMKPQRSCQSASSSWLGQRNPWCIDSTRYVLYHIYSNNTAHFILLWQPCEISYSYIPVRVEYPGYCTSTSGIYLAYIPYKANIADVKLVAS